MARTEFGSGRPLRDTELAAIRRALAPEIPPVLDLNTARQKELSAHPSIGPSLAAKIVRERRKAPLETPADLLRVPDVSPRLVRALEEYSVGRVPLHPLITRIATPKRRVYVGEPFALGIDFLKDTPISARILSVEARFPSGTLRQADFRITDEKSRAGRVVLDGFVSAEAGEFHLVATLRDDTGRVHEQAATFSVFTRNPVRLYVTPSFLTQSGRAGAPRYHFGEKRWYCEASVRWVNSTASTVNLGRRVTVRMTDAGSHIGTFSFNLSGDIVIPAWSTVYGSLYTRHGTGSKAYDVYIKKGDLTYQYSMSGSGYTPTRHQVWRAMRVIGYNIIRIGDFSATERNEYRRAAAEIASGIFRSRDMTVYDVERYKIEGTAAMDADKARYRFIDNQTEMDDVSSKYRVPNWYLDVFFVEGIWDGSFGYSYVKGPVDKNGKRSGILIRGDSDTVNLGQTFAHEAGHYLGLEHADENDGCADTNPSDPNISDNFIFSSSRRDSDVVTKCQIDKMRRHGLVRSMTP